SNGEPDRIMLHSQRLMNHFLETQQQVMLTYLRGSTDGAPLPTGASAATDLLDAAWEPALTPQSSPPMFSSSVSSEGQLSADLTASSTKAPLSPEPASVQELQPSMD